MATGNTGGAAGAEVGVGYLSIVPEATDLAKFLKSDLDKAFRKAGESAGKKLDDAIAKSVKGEDAGEKAGDEFVDGFESKVSKSKVKPPKIDVPELPDFPELDLRFDLDASAFQMADREVADLRGELERLSNLEISDPFDRFGRDVAAAGIKGELDKIEKAFKDLETQAQIDGNLDIDGAADLAGVLGDLDRVRAAAKGIDVQLDVDSPDFSEVESAAEDAGDESGDQFAATFLGTAGAAIATGAAALFVPLAGAAFLALSGGLNQGRSEGLLAASIGDPEDAAALGDLAAELYVNGYGEGFEENLPSLRSLYLASGRELGTDFADEAMAAINFEEVFGIDAGEFTFTAGAGEDAGLGSIRENMEGIIRTAQVVDGEVLPEILDGFKEYSVSAALAGLTTEEFLGILARQAPGGSIQIDKAGDAIKEFTIRAADGSKASAEAFDTIGLDAEEMFRRVAAGGDDAAGAFDETVSGLLAIEDPAVRANTAIALFGTPLEDLSVDQIPEFLESLQSGESGLEDFGTAFEDFDDAVTSADEARPFTNLLKELKQGIIDFGVDEILPLLDDLAIGIEGFRAGFSGEDTDAGGFVGFMEDLGGFVADLADKFEEHKPDIVAALTEVKDKAIELADAVEEYWPKIEETIDDVSTSVEDILESLEVFWDEHGEEIGRIVDQIPAAVRFAFDAVRGIIETAFSALSLAVAGFVAITTGDWQQLWDTVKSTASNRMSETDQAVLNSLMDITRNVTIWTVNAVKAFVGKIQGLVDRARQLPGEIKSAVGDLGGLLLQAGKDIVQGLIDGIQAKASALISTASSLAGSVASAFKGVLQIESPSKLFAEYGVNIVEGLNQGIETESPTSIGVANDWASDIAGTFASDIANMDVAPGDSDNSTTINVNNPGDGRPWAEQLNEALHLVGA